MRIYNFLLSPPTLSFHFCTKLFFLAERVSLLFIYIFLISILVISFALFVWRLFDYERFSIWMRTPFALRDPFSSLMFAQRHVNDVLKVGNAKHPSLLYFAKNVYYILMIVFVGCSQGKRKLDIPLPSSFFFLFLSICNLVMHLLVAQLDILLQTDEDGAWGKVSRLAASTW